MRNKKTYPHLYKWAYATGKENQIILTEDQNKIPKQTKSNWRKTSPEEILKLEKDLELRELIEEMASQEDRFWTQKKRLFHAITKLHLSTIEIIGKEKYLKHLGSNKKDFVEMIEKYAKVFPKKSLLKWFQINLKRYERWQSEVMFDCKSSQSLLCAKRHPFQITKTEYNLIKTNLEKEEYKTWSKRAVHSELFKKKLLTISRSTFYKHAKNIIKSRRKSQFRKDSYIPLRATYVNEYWHMDLSYFKTKDGKTQYVHCILDNFSRKIIAWRCEQSISAANVCKLLEEALNSVSIHEIKLISDGGTENFNDKTRYLIYQYNVVPEGLTLIHLKF
jgi:hypothetical protein